MVWAAPPLPRRARSTETPPSPHTREFNEPGPERSRGEPGVSAGFLVMVVVREEAPRRKGGVRRGAGLAAPHNGEGLSRGLQHEPDVSARASREPRHSHQFIEGHGVRMLYDWPRRTHPPSDWKPVRRLWWFVPRLV
jgi:hypothetical protein